MPINFPMDPVTAPKTPDEFRTQIRNLIHSYHAADMDLLQEIVQNSVDAIEDRFSSSSSEEVPRIELELDREEGALTIRDNGPGITTKMLQKLATPATTDKVGRRKRGHKGVGLSFAAWSSSLFRFATRRVGDANIVSGKLEGGIDWIRGKLATHPKIDEDPSFKPDFLGKHESGTVFEFKLGKDHELIRLLNRLNRKGVETLLRTNSAMGYVDLRKIDGNGTPAWVQKCDATLRIDGKHSFKIPLGYYFPQEHFKKKAFDLRNMPKLSLAALEKLKGRKKCIYHTMANDKILSLFSEEDEPLLLKKVKEQEVTAYGAFLDKSRTFRDWNNSLYEGVSSAGRRRRIVRAGIHFSTVTMPTGEVKDIELPYGSGNKDRLYIVVQFRDAHPDYGRKTFERSVVEIGQKVASHFTKNIFVPNREFLVPASIPHGDTESEREMTLNQERDFVRSKSDLSLQGIGIVKAPSTEEDVVALFHALLGGKYLRGYEIYSVHGSTKKYDAWFKYYLKEKDDVLFPHNPLGLHKDSFGQLGKVEFPLSVLEFKPSLSHLIDDFEAGIKSFEDILVAVAWDKGDDAAFGGSSDYSLEPVVSSTKEKQFHGETYTLRTTSLGKRIHVVLLSDVISVIVGQMTDT